MALKLVLRLVKCPMKGQMYTEWCRVEVDQGITHGKSDIVDIYREESARELNPMVSINISRLKTLITGLANFRSRAVHLKLIPSSLMTLLRSVHLI